MISILIRCSDDYRVLDCIASIKSTSPKSPIIVSMTPNKRLQESIISVGVTYCIVPKHNAAITNNKGLELVKTDKVIITDADTLFEKEAINLLDKALGKYDVVKPRLVFRPETNFSYFSPVANLRTFFNDNDKKMYIPGLAFNLSIKSKIGGYFFDEQIPWGEDSDFSDRVERRGLKTKVIEASILYHPSVDMLHDLADAFLIGLKKKDKEFINKNIISKRIKFFKKLASKGYGFPTLVYGFVWYLFFDLGRLLRVIKPIRRKLEQISWMALSSEKNKHGK
jgi:hypothetical protein